LKLSARSLAAVFICVSAAAFASDYKAGLIEIDNPWSRATPKGASTAIGYMTIKNNGTAPDRLVAASVEVAGSVEFHSMVMENGISKMRDLPSIEIKPSESVELKPGSTHAMFVDLKHSLQKGEHVPGTLTFEHAGTVRVEYSVEGMGARQPEHDMSHMH
jgi:periplasmic copper chaperone A